MIGQILALEPSGERFTKVHFFSAEEGLGIGLLRKSRKINQLITPDLFDLADLHWDPPKGAGARFISDYRLIQRRENLARHFDSFQAAARLCRLFLENGRHWLQPEGPAERLAKAFDLWEAGYPGHVVYLKALFLLLEDEGLPIREEWLAGLSPGDRSHTKAILVAEWEKIRVDSTLRPTTNLIESLENWATAHHFEAW